MMVFPYDEKRLLIVLQTDHSRVAGELAAHWSNDKFAEPEPWMSMVLAAQEHDTGWWEWELKPTLSERALPPDYISAGGIPRDVHVAFDRNGISRVLEQDRYAGLMVSMHQAGLNNQGFGMLPHMPDRSAMPGVGEFLREQEELRQKLIEELRRSQEFASHVSEERIWTNYKLMEVFDQLAQILCNRYPLNSAARKNGPPSVLKNVPVAPGVDDVALAIEMTDERSAVLRPYPFDIDPLEVSFPARLVPSKDYTSQDEFLRQFYKADRLTITYALRPS
jgi:hypothetical protein